MSTKGNEDYIKSLKANTHRIVTSHQEAVENQNLQTEFLLSLNSNSSKKQASENIDNKPSTNTLVVNKNISKDVGRIIVSIFIKFLVTITPHIKDIKYIYYSCYALISINVLYLIIKLNKINGLKEKTDDDNELIIPLTLNDAILRTEINDNTNTQSTKSFFRNIETTPLSRKKIMSPESTSIRNEKPNAADSSYTLSSKFTYKINKN